MGELAKVRRQALDAQFDLVDFPLVFLQNNFDIDFAGGVANGALRLTGTLSDRTTAQIYP